MLNKFRNSVILAITFITICFTVFAYSASVHKITDFVIFCIYVLGFDVLYGHMGRISFGHPLYLGAGAYGAAMCAKYIYPDPFFCMVLGVTTGALVGLILGPIVVKTKGAAFALINVAFNQLGYFVVLVALARYTGGEDGVSLMFNSYGILNFNDRNFLFFFSLGSLIFVYYLMHRLYSSAFGAMLLGIKENEIRVRFLGYNTSVYKWVAFIISTSVSAFAGSLYVVNYAFANPSFIDPARNVEVIFAALIGGAGTEFGGVLGGTAYMTISNYLAKYISRWEMFLGAALLIIAFRFRKGLVGYAREFIDKHMQTRTTTK